MPRGPRFDIPGMTYHVICRGIERREIFIDTQDYRFFLRTLERVIKEEAATLYAFCLMPNHVHLLLKPKAGLATLMRRLLTSYALYFNRRYKRVGYLFQNRFNSTPVQHGAYFLELIRYIHLNPLRAGIVEDIKHLSFYPYTGHAALMGHDAGLVAAEDVLVCFAAKKGHARALLTQFMQEGLEKAHDDRPIASIKEQIVDKGSGNNESSIIDKRILGDASFAAELIEKFEERRNPAVQEAHLRNLLKRTASYFGLSCDELCSGTKQRHIARARSVAIFLGAKQCGIPPKVLANALGVRASTVYEILRTRKGEEESKNIVLDS